MNLASFLVKGELNVQCSYYFKSFFKRKGLRLGTLEYKIAEAHRRYIKKEKVKKEISGQKGNTRSSYSNTRIKIVRQDSLARVESFKSIVRNEFQSVLHRLKSWCRYRYRPTILVSVSVAIWGVNIGNISHIGSNIGQYYMLNIVLGTSKFRFDIADIYWNQPIFEIMVFRVLWFLFCFCV